MPKYRYTAADSFGKTVRGVMFAAGEQELHRKLKETDQYLLHAKEVRTEHWEHAWSPKILSEFCRELAVLLRAGISLVQALTMLAQLEGLGRRERRTCQEVLRLIRRGMSFSDALEYQGTSFPALMIFTFRAAEETGRLDITAEQLADYYMQEYKINEKLAEATAYPKLLAALIAVILAVLAGYVLPQFEFLFSMMEELPLPTRLLYGGIGLCRRHWVGGIVVLVLVLVIRRWICGISAVRFWIDRLLVHLPVAGRIWNAVYTARFARTLSLLYRAGIPLAAGMPLASKTVGNTYISRQLDIAAAKVRAGESLGEVLGSIDGFTVKLAAAVRIGGEGQRLDDMLESMAAAMEYDAHAAVARKMVYLEPIMIIVMAVIAGFIMIAVMMPIYESYSAIEMLACR